MSKAISLNQPWATLVVLGHKKWETRSWAMKYRGTLWLHASKGFPGTAKHACRTGTIRECLIEALGSYDTFSGAMPRIGGQNLPLGAIIGRVEVTDCQQLLTPATWADLSSRELALGYYDLGRYRIKLENPRALVTPIPAKGMLGLWDCTEHVDGRELEWEVN